MATTSSIHNLDTAITQLALFHDNHLIRPSQLTRPTLVQGHFFADAIRTLKEDERLSEILSTHELPSYLLDKLISGPQRYADVLNQLFNRSFAHHPSLVLAVDPVSCGATGGVLTHERQDPVKKMLTKAITGGGLVDAEETTVEAAYRELEEESGGGCALTACRLALVVDGVRSMRPYFMSCAFEAQHAGTPVSNHEAKTFEEIPYEAVSQHTWFTDHASIVGDVLGMKHKKCSYPGEGIPYSSKGTSFPTHQPSKSFKPVLTDVASISHALNAVNRVVAIYEQLTTLLEKEFIAQVDQAALADSCNQIGHGWERETVAITAEIAALRTSWNDDKRLWDFMGPLKLAAIEISSLFGTFINTGEGGVIEMAPLYVAGDQVFLKNVEGKLTLHRELLTQFRNFKDSLHHHAAENGVALKPEHLPMLTDLYEDPSNKYRERMRSRVFGFILDMTGQGGVPLATNQYSIAEARNLPSEAWATIHDYNIFQRIMSAYLTAKL